MNTISSSITSKEFSERYWLKEELVQFCKDNNLSTSGSKDVISSRIINHLEHKPEQVIKPRSSSAHKAIISEISLTNIISESYANDELHREFFSKEIGPHFKFNVQFMNWMKEEKGKSTYQKAIEKWNELYELKKKGVKYQISSQFKYNQYTRDFFKDNPTLSRKDCITCWKYKKTQLGNHTYDKSDLKVLNS